MSVNNHRPHVLVLPEDEANEELVNGFLLDPSIKLRNIQVLPSAGGCAPRSSGATTRRTQRAARAVPCGLLAGAALCTPGG